jgi:glycosyltransferase involved in cell wall biosynthesis
MKILHIIPNLKRGGAERLVIDIVRALSMKPAVNVKLILFGNKIEYTINDLSSLINIVESSVQLSLIKSHNYNIDDLQRMIEKFDPDIIHTHLFEAEIISRACYYPKAKWFSHGHDRMRSFNNLKLSSFGNKRKLTDYFERRYLFQRYKLNGGNQFIAISDDIETFLKDVLPNEIRNIHLLQNAIDVTRFEKDNSKPLALKDLPLKLISIGRLDKNKNHQFLLECILALKALKLNVHLTILGEGDQRILLEQQIEKMNLYSEVSLLGSIENVEEYLWQSDIYVHSAITEGFGLTLMEAMAAGLPVITLDGGGNRDLIIEGKNGYLMEDINPVTFAKRIADLWANKEKMREMGEFAQRFAQKFSIDSYCDKLLEIYKNA